MPSDDEATEPVQPENFNYAVSEPVDNPYDSDSDYPPNYSTSETEVDSSDDEFGFNAYGKAKDGRVFAPEKEEKEYKGNLIPEFDEYFEELDQKYQKREQDFIKVETKEDLYNFPVDKEDWQEEDLMELWTDGPPLSNKPGWDPTWADKREWKLALNEIRQGKDFPLAPYYVPYRRHYPVIPSYQPRAPLTYRRGKRSATGRRYCKDLQTPKDIIEELDMIEEVLKWVSYVFPDGSSYEGTVWDDVAQGKGVYVRDQGLVRYEGEWLRNMMEGHGVVEVDIPDDEPIPGSEFEEEMRAEGKIIRRDYVPPKDKEWLEMDIEDSINLTGGKYVTPMYEDEAWITTYGKLPEKGRYRYAGQWKHNRMHGCGVYEYNEKTIFGRFYFGELMEDPVGCDEENSTLHAGIAEVAAAKARMFVNKPDGMVREQRGPYMDPQHPYFYEEADAWQAPGFVHQFYDVPDPWKVYAHEVDQERAGWLNSFYRSPLRIPMPAELEHWWETDPDDPEFVLVNKEPEPDPEDPTKLVYTEDPLILHTRTGRLINYVEDEEHGIRLFWQPPASSKKDINYKEVEFLPLGYEEMEDGYDEKLEKKREEKEIKMLQDRVSNWVFEWVEKKKKEGEERMKLMEKEMELVDVEVELEEALKDMEEELEAEDVEEEAAEKVQQQQQVASSVEEKVSVPSPVEKVEKKAEPKKETVQVQEEEENSDSDDSSSSDDDSDEEEDDVAPSSFGTVGEGKRSVKSPFSTVSLVASGLSTDSMKRDGKGSGKSPFFTLSLATSALMSAVHSSTRQSFLSLRKQLSPLKAAAHFSTSSSLDVSSVTTSPLFKSAQFPRSRGPHKVRLRAVKQPELGVMVYPCQRRRRRSSHQVALDSPTYFPRNSREYKSSRNLNWLHGSPENITDYALSLHSLTDHLNPGAVNGPLLSGDKVKRRL